MTTNTTRNLLKRNAPSLLGMTTFTSQGTRPGQEDFLLVVKEKSIFVMADGFGGPVPGALAARTSCESIRNYLVKEAGDLEATLPFVLRSYFSLAGNVLFNSLIFANRKIMSLNRSRNINEKGGASVIAAYMDGDLLALANVGLCTAWLFRDGKVTDLVMPRSYQKLLNPFWTGDPSTSMEGDSFGGAEIPLMALGMSDDLQPEIFEYRIQEGDWLTLQTDGIPFSVRGLIASIHARNLRVEDSLSLVNEAISSQHYTDNAAISVVLF